MSNGYFAEVWDEILEGPTMTTDNVAPGNAPLMPASSDDLDIDTEIQAIGVSTGDQPGTLTITLDDYTLTLPDHRAALLASLITAVMDHRPKLVDLTK